MATHLDNLGGAQVSRRGFLGGAAALAGAAALNVPRRVAAATNLDFVVWNYAVDIIQDNINLFQEKYPDVTVKLSDFAWPAFHETMVNRFQSETPTDVA